MLSSTLGITYSGTTALRDFQLIKIHSWNFIGKTSRSKGGKGLKAVEWFNCSSMAWNGGGGLGVYG